jgi:hypothetical protein
MEIRRYGNKLKQIKITHTKKFDTQKNLLHNNIQFWSTKEVFKVNFYHNLKKNPNIIGNYWKLLKKLLLNAVNTLLKISFLNNNNKNWIFRLQKNTIEIKHYSLCICGICKLQPTTQLDYFTTLKYYHSISKLIKFAVIKTTHFFFLLFLVFTNDNNTTDNRCQIILLV